MKFFFRILNFGLLGTVIGGDLPVQISVVRTIAVVRPRDMPPGVQVAAIVPTDKGQIGINPPPPEAIKGSIGEHTQYLTDLGTTTQWIGVNKDYITVATTTSTNKAGSTAVATITKGVSATKNKAGGIDFLLSPAVRTKLEAIAKEVTPCPAKRRRRSHAHLHKRGGPACGLPDFIRRVGEDPQLKDTLSRPLTDQVWGEIDEGYKGAPGENAGWEGDGAHLDHPEDEGYFTDDEAGFFERPPGPHGEATGETIVFTSIEEAEALEKAAAAGTGVAWIQGVTLTTGTFLVMVYGSLAGSGKLEPVYQVPKESIHKITKTATQSSTSTNSCPAATTGPMICDAECVATTHAPPAKATGFVWACSEGKQKGCDCVPRDQEFVTPYNQEFQHAIWDALKTIENNPPVPKVSCETTSGVPSKWFMDSARDYCKQVADLSKSVDKAEYDVYGHDKNAPKKRSEAVRGVGHETKLLRRTPPETQDTYKEYTFSLGFNKAEGECSEDIDGCVDAFEKLVRSQCGTNSGALADRLFVDASIDVGCGSFYWHVEAPKKEPSSDPPMVTDQECHSQNNAKHRDVDPAFQEFYSTYFCDIWMKDKIFKPGDPAVEFNPITAYVSKDQRYLSYRVSWMGRCRQFQEQSVKNPVPDDPMNCTTLMRENYKHCNNGGAGGWRQAGCLWYEFTINDYL